MRTRKGEARRFLVAVNSRRPDHCVLWPFAMDRRTGYGRCGLNGRQRTAHRVALILATGEDPPGLDAAHSCHNRRCVNPRHLRWATRSENVVEMVAAGRHPRTGPRKLTDTDREQILRRRSNGERVCDLADAYQVHPQTIYRIHKGTDLV